MKILGSALKSGGIQRKSGGLQRKTVVSNDNFRVSNKNPGSLMKIWRSLMQVLGFPMKIFEKNWLTVLKLKNEFVPLIC